MGPLPGRVSEYEQQRIAGVHAAEASRDTVLEVLTRRSIAKFGPELRAGTMTGAQARGAVAVGALALGAAAVGGFAIGRLSIGRLAVSRASVRRLEIDELEIGRVQIRERPPQV